MTYHQQRFAQRSTPFSQDFVRIEGNNITQRKDEGVHIFHIEVVGRNGIGDGVLSQDLRLFNGIPACQLYSAARHTVSSIPGRDR